MKSMQAAAKVGGLVVLFGAMSLGAAAMLNQSIFRKATTPYQVTFEDAGGLTPGSRVMIAGVLAGQVDKVALNAEGLAVAQVSLDQPHKITEGTLAVLPSSLLSVGDREIQLTLGPGAPLAPGSSIPGTLRSPIDGMMPDLDTTMGKVNDMLTSLNVLLGDAELKGRLTTLMAGTERVMVQGANTAASVERLVNRLDGMAVDNRAKLVSIVSSADRSMASVAAMTKEAEKLLAKGDLQDQTKQLLTSLNEAATQGKNLVAELNKVVADPTLQASLKTSATNVTEMTQSGTRVAKNFEEISAQGLEASKKVNDLLVKANAMADDVKKLLEKFSGTVERLGGAQRDLGSRITAEADVLSNSETGRVRTDLSLSIPVGKEKAVFGMYDAFESNKFNLQLQRQLAEGLDVRYGVYASKLGVGVDYRLAPSLQARGDLFGLNDPQLDLRLRYDFSQSIYGWVGMERVFQRSTPVFGIGIRRRP
jgi:phospholipid/cholesterol/gamma-HCH transport system substrate-binding protein